MAVRRRYVHSFDRREDAVEVLHACAKFLRENGYTPRFCVGIDEQQTAGGKSFAVMLVDTGAPVVPCEPLESKPLALAQALTNITREGSNYAREH